MVTHSFFLPGKSLFNRMMNALDGITYRRSCSVCAQAPSKSACFKTSSARIRFKMNSASFATRTMWSFMACESSRPSLMSSINAKPACFCNEFCHSCEHNSITSSTTLVLFLNVINPENWFRKIRRVQTSDA